MELHIATTYVCNIRSSSAKCCFPACPATIQDTPAKQNTQRALVTTMHPPRCNVAVNCCHSDGISTTTTPTSAVSISHCSHTGVPQLLLQCITPILPHMHSNAALSNIIALQLLPGSALHCADLFLIPPFCEQLCLQLRALGQQLLCFTFISLSYKNNWCVSD